MSPRLVTALIASISLSACKVEPAPEDLDGLAHWFWQHLDDEEPDALQAGALNVYEALEGTGYEWPLKGTITTLSAEELALVGHGDESREALYGVLMANEMDCSTAGLEYQIYAPEQAEMHASTYVSYEREFLSDREAYEARETDWIEWQSHYEVDGFGYSYEATINGWLRYVSEIPGHEHAGPMLVARGVLDEPAPFGDSEERGMFQDYQLEVYVPSGSDTTFHFYAIWREMVFIGSYTMEDEEVQNTVLDGLYDWDVDAMEYCGATP
jgi:hypothetical protein